MQRIFNNYCAQAVLLLMVLFSNTGCRKDKTTEVVVTDYYERIRFAVENNSDYNGYTACLAAAGLLDSMASPGPYTILLSNFYKFNLPTDVQGPEWDPLMHYQVMRGVKRLDTLPLKTNMPIATLLGTDLYVSRYAVPNEAGGKDTVTSVNGSEVINGNIKASNGMIHVVEHLVGPLQYTNLYDLLLSREELRFMAIIADRLNMKSLLQDKGPYTFLVPTNAAFVSDPALADLGIQTVDDIYTADTAVLGSLVRTHLLRGRFFKKDFMWQYLANGTDSYTALSGKTITVSLLPGSGPFDFSGVSFSGPGNTTPASLYFGPDYSTPQEGFVAGNGVLIMLYNALIP